MTEYITKDQAYLCMLENWDGDMLPGDYDDLLREIPPADVAPVVHGQWEYEQSYASVDDYDSFAIYKCSNCGDKQMVPSDYLLKLYKYCPNCGARMEGEEE